jgi:ring-1,2-phenylacetyl-CoA epoxidase subunit PaaD
MTPRCAMTTRQQIYEWLNEVTDPEVPVLSILDLGIVRDVTFDEQTNQATVVITPTYSGCPAMNVIAANIRMTLLSRGLRHIQIEHRLSPAWTTDWMSEVGRQKLRDYGIAPPQYKMAEASTALFESERVACPRCRSAHTEIVSQFGATSCKALYKCLDCLEPFEHFKCH